MRKTITGVAMLSALALMAGCGTQAKSDSATGSAKQQAVSVVATTTQICDYVTQIAGTDVDGKLVPASEYKADSKNASNVSLVKTGSDGKTNTYGAPEDKASAVVRLTCLLAPNASAHTHEMTPQQMKALQNADIFLVSGVDLEHFLDEAVKASGFHGTMAVTSGILSSKDIDNKAAELEKEKTLPYKVDRGTEEVKVAAWPFPPEEGETEPEFRFDPHIWTSPANALIQVENTGAALEKAVPAGKDIFAKHTDMFAKRIKDLNQWAADSFATVPQEHRVLFSSHDAFGYLSKNYGIKFIGSALTDFNAQADATAAHINEMVKQVKDSGARAIFAENSNNSKSIQQIADAAGVKAIIGDDALYGDSLGPAGSAGETYLGSIIHNVKTLVNAWDGKPAPLPQSLKSSEVD